MKGNVSITCSILCFSQKLLRTTIRWNTTDISLKVSSSKILEWYVLVPTSKNDQSLLPTNCLSLFDHFWGLTLKELTHFWPIFAFYSLLKSLENIWFSGVFSGYKLETLSRNEISTCVEKWFYQIYQYFKNQNTEAYIIDIWQAHHVRYLWWRFFLRK